jgi:hypothetical protein
MDPIELLIKARYDDELDEALKGAVVVTGAGGAEDGGACPAFVIVSPRGLSEHAEKLREVIREEHGHNFILQLVQSKA